MNNDTNTSQTDSPAVQIPREITLDTILDSYLKGNRVAPTIAYDITGIFDSEPETPKGARSCIRSNQKDLDKINHIIQVNRLGLMTFPAQK